MLYSPVEKSLLKGFPLLGKISQSFRIFRRIRAWIAVGFVRTARPGFSFQQARHTGCRGEGFYGEFSEKLCRIGGMVPHRSANRAVGCMGKL
jgi:hypothetical protein